MKKVFLIEDDAVILSGLAAGFGSLGIEVFSSKGDEDIGFIVKSILMKKIDFVVLDLVLPKIDSFVLLGAIKGEIPSLPVFVFSDFSEDDVRRRCDAFGADYYYLKQDFNTESFVEKVDKILKNRDKLKI